VTPSAEFNWSARARLRRGLASIRGTLTANSQRVEFRPEKNPPRQWPYAEIETLDIGSLSLVLTSYENRGWHRPGNRQYRFELGESISAAVSRELAQRVGKPVKNRIPLPESSSFSTIPAHHRTHTGGSNGLLRFREEGIDYLTQAPRDSRAWRWRDIETLAIPDPYTFRVQGYRETFSFELKEPMPPELFNRLWDKVYAGDPAVAGLAVEVIGGPNQPSAELSSNSAVLGPGNRKAAEFKNNSALPGTALGLRVHKLNF
jgi:hypothetical protein